MHTGIIYRFIAATTLLVNSLIVLGQPQTAEILDPKQQSIVKIASYTAQGDIPGLKQALADGLVHGMTVNEIKEELLHISAYCGFPRSLNGIIAFSAVVEDRKSKGITDVIGEKASKVTDTNKYETGKKVLESLTGQPERYPKTGYAAFVPAVDTLLKEHLFNDLFTRGVLNYEQRELTTIAALLTLGGVESQLFGHINIALNLGITPKQLSQLISILETNIGRPHSDVGRKVLARAVEGRK